VIISYSGIRIPSRSLHNKILLLYRDQDTPIEGLIEFYVL
jgi:hypothetical protein